MGLAPSSCSLCQEELYRNPHCLLPEHLCMTQLSPEAVWPLVRQAWNMAG